MAGRYGEAQHARLRYQTWMQSHRRMSAAMILMTAVTGLSLALAAWSLTSKPEPRYFATREDGGILPLVPISSPFLSDGEVTNFAVDAVTRALTMDFANWRSDLTGAADYFERPGGWNSFLDAIEDSGMLSYIRERRLVSTAVANGAVIVSSGLDAARRHRWTVEIPLTVTYESASEVSRDNLFAEVTIARLPTWETASAVGITQIVVRPGRPSGQ